MDTRLGFCDTRFACLLGSAKPPSLPWGRTMFVPRTLVALLALLAAPAFAAAQTQASYDIPAHVASVDGVALLERTDGDEALETNLTLVEGDRVRTRRGRVEILF